MRLQATTSSKANGAPRGVWRVLRGLLPPLILLGLVGLALREPLDWWLHGEEIYDQEAIKEWVREARVFTTLPELVKGYIGLADQHHDLKGKAHSAAALRALQQRLAIKREEVLEHLKALGNPPTKMYPGQLPLFPVIYRITVAFHPSLALPDIIWDSEVPRQRSQYRELPAEPVHARATASVQYHLHAYLQRQSKERQEATRRLWLSGLGILFALLAILWIYLAQRRERERQRQRLLAEQQVTEADRRRLEEELRRQEAERKHQEVERQNLELKSQMFANIGIMAGSYAHNIKNLLVRPNDLLRRCLEDAAATNDQAHMLREVKQTLGTVTERLQQILQTVRRDPSKAERVRIDLNQLASEIHATWADLAQDKWKLVVELELCAGPLWIEGDLSHLQQALENLFFNARDATFEMRNHLREQARTPARSEAGNADSGSRDSGSRDSGASLGPERRHALIAAAGWKGKVTIRTKREGDQAVLEVQDNGIGMTEDVKRRCTETHFSTKRNNALFAGLSAGMGLGLSFVTVILEHHNAALDIDTQPLQGACFQVRFARAA